MELLIAARVLQGVGGAIIAPTALSLIATTFAEGPARSRAIGVYAAMAGIGSTVGLLLGGLLTDALNWRWVMFINIPIGIGVLLGTRILAEGTGGRGRLDVPGALTGTAGLVSLVYAITRGGDAGFGTDASPSAASPPPSSCSRSSWSSRPAPPTRCCRCGC